MNIEDSQDDNITGGVCKAQELNGWRWNKSGQVATAGRAINYTKVMVEKRKLEFQSN